MNFEMLLDILIFEVIGWDMKNNRPTEHVGYYGVPEGLSFAVEQQGRKTLHVHMSIWIKAVKALQEDIFLGTKDKELPQKGNFNVTANVFALLECFRKTARF